MADTKISALTALTAPASNDELIIVDKSDTSMAPSGTDKRITASDLLAGGAGWDWVNVADYGADPTYFAADSSQAFIDALAEAGGVPGVSTARPVYVPSGTYRMDGTEADASWSGIVIPDGVSLIGDGVGCTALAFSNLASGEIAVDTETGAVASTQQRRIQGMRIVGQGGVTTAGTIGVRLSALVGLVECHVTDFTKGVQMYGDHQLIFRSYIANNYDGVNFPNDMPTAGDMLFLDCALDNNSRTGVRIENAMYGVGIQFVRCHFGSGPFGVYAEAEASAGTITALLDCTFDMCYWEGYGNCAVECQNRDIGTTTFRHCIFSKNNIYASGSFTTPDSVINCYRFKNSQFSDPKFVNLSGAYPANGFLQVGYSMENSQLRDASFLAELMINQDWPMVTAPTTAHLSLSGATSGSWVIEFARCNGGSGYCEVVAFNGVASGASDTPEVVKSDASHLIGWGVGLHTTATNRPVAVLRKGRVGVPSSGTINAKDYVKATTSGSVIAASGPTDAPLLGIAAEAAAGGQVSIWLSPTI